ncbi:cupin domain-containing protein [Rhizobium alvei]|uniref:Cupin domain-containing protein n=1 Tax=Rhizobium alvei TaxID=1132659 RepID=A0ABT8YG75_9HYPH|nr:cupin domain-containing protein [Rhizobium alvei]MDO6962674.1 cupin domain-containing protein [Rhizobium alvei]
MAMPVTKIDETISNPMFIAKRAEDVALVDAPIKAEWIVSGNPKARAGLHSPSLDGGAATNIWDCTAGSFWWTFYSEETVMILEGEVRVTSEAGETRVLKPGDIAYFAQDSRALWEIERYVKKVAFCRHKPSNPVRKLRSALRALKSTPIKNMVSVRLLATIGVVLPL